MPRRILFPLLPLFLLCSAGVAGAQERGPCAYSPPSDPTYYADMKEMPAGKYSLSYTFDRAQIDNASTPVIVRGLNGITGTNQRSGKLGCAEIENRSPRTVKAVHLRWAVTARADDGDMAEVGPVLAKGTLPAVEVEIPAGVRQRAVLRGAHFADFLQPLAAAGELDGGYNLSVGVARVEYADGTAEDLP